MARVLICGTLAYDDIGHFATPLTGTTRNVKLDRLDRDFGGCAMNIAYNLAGLGHQSVPFVYAGDDYAAGYAHHVASHGISETGIFRIPGVTSARGIVLTGSDGAQFTAFYPGPSGSGRWHRDLDELLAGDRFDAVIVAPDLPHKMVGCAARTRALGLRIWCPGQYAELLKREDIEVALEHCNLLVANRHEWSALAAAMAGDEHLRTRVGRAVITDGPNAVEVLNGRGRGAGRRSTRVAVEAVAASRAIDPTGCGDAFVAALADALLSGTGLSGAVTAGARLAARCLRCRGSQSHRVRHSEGTAE